MVGPTSSAGILDTGFERSHEAFAYPGHPLNVLAEWDFLNEDGDIDADGDVDLSDLAALLAVYGTACE